MKEPGDILIQRLDLDDGATANSLLDVQKSAYRIEAALIGFDAILATDLEERGPQAVLSCSYATYTLKIMEAIAEIIAMLLHPLARPWRRWKDRKRRDTEFSGW